MMNSVARQSAALDTVSELVVASGNRGKVKELQALFSSLDMKLHLQSDLQVVPAEETGLSFIENAILKARAAAEQTGLPALADDSGLAVDALRGLPGVRSARYGEDGGYGTGDAGNKQRLLEALSDVPEENRQARFHCVLVLLRHPEDPVPLIAQGAWEGRILTTEAGDKGFGYDPIFYVPDHSCSAAQLDVDTKNVISHRGRAAQQLLAMLR